MEIIDRIKSPTPDFFKKIRKKALILTVIASSIVGAQKTGELIFPEWLFNAAKHVAFMGATAVSIAQTTKNDK